ncbi:MAG: hypothetical protein ACQER6_01615 [Pseudomonadota bacterium]
MIKAKHLMGMTTAVALTMTSGLAAAASMEEYQEARADAIEAAESVKEMGPGAFPHSPTGSKWKKPLMAGADKLAEKGKYDEAIAEAKRIEGLQSLAEQQYEEQPNPGPYNPW